MLKTKRHSAALTASFVLLALVLCMPGSAAGERGGQPSTDTRSAAETRAQASQAPARITVLDPVRPQGAIARVAGRAPLEGGDRVAIGFKPRGGSKWWNLSKIRTNRRGVFATRFQAVRNGHLLAVPRIGRPSRAVGVRVISRTRFGVDTRHVNLGQSVRLTGGADPGGRRPFRVAIKGPDGSVIDRATSRRGTFREGWKPQVAGRYVLRAFSGRNLHAYGSKGPRRVVNVYRPAGASWYGPGFYGGRSACGHTLTPSTEGVAHKALPCGTPVRIRYGSRVVATRVIDRGPFIPGREFDLTEATRNQLGFGDVGTIHVSH